MPATYYNLILSRWLRSLRFGNDYFKLVRPDAYYAAYSRYIGSILGGSETVIRLAVLDDDRDVVLGFSVARGTALDYVHVHKDARKRGIGTALVPKDIDQITHVTKTGLSIWGSKYPGWSFNPFV